MSQDYFMGCCSTKAAQPASKLQNTTEQSNAVFIEDISDATLPCDAAAAQPQSAAEADSSTVGESAAAKHTEAGRRGEGEQMHTGMK
jgi:hypothetical protein